MVHLSGQVTDGDTVYSINLASDADQVNGGVDVKDVPVLVEKVGGKLFFRGGAYFASQGSATGERWVLAPGDLLTNVVNKLINRSDLARALRKAAGDSVQRKSGPVIAGKQSDELAGSGVSVFVASAGTGPPLRFQSAGGTELSDHFSNLKLDLDYTKPVHLDMPAKFVDLNDRNTLPVHFVDVPGTISFDSCTTQGCTLSVQVRNTGGLDGAATVTFIVKRQGTQLGSCIADIKTVGPNQVTSASCHISFDDTVSVTAYLTVNNLVT